MIEFLVTIEDPGLSVTLERFRDRGGDVNKLMNDLLMRFFFADQGEDVASGEQALIQDLRQEVFADLVATPFRELQHRAQEIGQTPRSMIRARLMPWALKVGISISAAEELFFRAFPEFAEELEGLA